MNRSYAAPSLNWICSVIDRTYPPRRPDFADVACGLTRGAATGAGAFAGVACGTFDGAL